MDQAASANQSFLRNFGERGQVTNLDRCLRLRSSRHRQKAIAFSASLYEILQILSLTMFGGPRWINYLHKR